MLIGPLLGAAEMEIIGGAGDDLSLTGDRLGVVGPAWPEVKGEPVRSVAGEPIEGDDGPGEDELTGSGGCGFDVDGEGDLDFESPDLVRERF